MPSAQCLNCQQEGRNSTFSADSESALLAVLETHYNASWVPDGNGYHECTYFTYYKGDNLTGNTKEVCYAMGKRRRFY